MAFHSSRSGATYIGKHGKYGHNGQNQLYTWDQVDSIPPEVRVDMSGDPFESVENM